MSSYFKIRDHLVQRFSICTHLQQLSFGDDQQEPLLSILLFSFLFESLQLLQWFGSAEGEGATTGAHLVHPINISELILHSTGPR